MNAIGFTKHGSADVLEQVEIEDPVLGEDEVSVRLSCTSVNMLDTLVRRGYMGLNITLPHVPGSDVVGKIENVGKNVRGFNPGETVVAHSLLACGKCVSCLSNNEAQCSNYKIVGRDMKGSYSELVKLPTSLLIKPPTYFSNEELACMPLSLATAWRALNTVADAKRDDTVIIRGASGNVGIFATLIAKTMGLKVIALSRNENKQKKLKGLKADLVINSKEPLKQVMDFTNGKGADFVLESFGSTLEGSIDMVHDGGKVILFGTIGGSTASFDVKKLYLRSKEVIGTHVSSKYEFQDALNFMDSNNIKPIIGKTLSLDDAASAHKLLENSEVFGKIVLKSNW